MANKTAKDMTVGSPLKMILLFSLPVLMGNIFQQFYNMVDTIIVGQYLGEDALAAVGSTGCLMFLVLGFANGIAQGFGVMVSHAFGAKDMNLLKHYVALSLMLTVMISVILTIPTVAASRQFLIWMHTPENILGIADAYIKVIFVGILLTMSYNVASGILRGIGDSKTPLYFLIFSSILNIILDVFFIVVVKLGTAGAAYATIIAQGVAAVLCFIYMFRKFDILKVERVDFYLDKNGVFHMLAIGIPMALNYSITAVGTMILQGAVNVFGSSVVAAFTAASKVESLSTQTMPTLGTAISTYCGQNLGAGRYDRIYEGMKKGFYICIAIALLASGICVFAGRFIVSWFVSNPTEMIYEYAMQYLNTISFCMLPLAWIFLYRNALQGLNRGFVPMLSGFVEMICRLLVVAFMLKPAGYWAVRLASPITWLATGIMLIAAYYAWEKRTKRGQKQNNITS